MTERNLRGVDLNLLVVFDALMAERHVTRAAQFNGLTQSAVSKALNRLRDLLGDSLFERREGRMEPTPRALELAGPIRSALAEISRTLTLHRTFEPRFVTGALRIAIIDLHHVSLLPALVARVRRDAPSLDLSICAVDRHRLGDQLGSGEIDLALAPVLMGSPGLHTELLWKDHLVTLIRAENRSPMTLEAFTEACHVVDAAHVHVSPDGHGSSLVDSILAARGLRRRIAVTLPSAAGIPFVVAATDLVATLPSRIVKGLAPLPAIRIVPAPLPPLEVSPHLFWHPRTHNSPSRAWLRAIIRETATDLETNGGWKLE